MLGDHCRGFYALREVRGLGRGILRRRHGRLGRGARGVLSAHELSGGVGMYSSSIRRCVTIVDGSNGLQGACGAGLRCEVTMALRPLGFLTGRTAASPSYTTTPALPLQFLRFAFTVAP